MGGWTSRQTVNTSYNSEPLHLTPVAETSQAQIYCRTEALQPMHDIPDEDKYVVRPKGGLCIQAKPRKYNGKVYYVVSMVHSTQGKKASEYLNLRLEQNLSEVSQIQTQYIVPNTTIAQPPEKCMAEVSFEEVKQEPPDELPELQVGSNPSSAPVSAQRGIAEVAEVPHFASPAAEEVLPKSEHFDLEGVARPIETPSKSEPEAEAKDTSGFGAVENPI